MAGFVSSCIPQRETVLRGMLESMRRERDRDSGVFAAEEMGLSMGWISREDGPIGAIPSWNAQGDVCLIFCGEEFSDSAEGAAGLVRLYEESGPGFFGILNGAFSGVLVDRREKRGFLFNDRFGLERVYCHENRDGFYFASEAKALLRVCPELREIDARALGELVTCGCVLQNRTLFRGVTLLPGGSVLTCQAGRVSNKGSYFSKKTWEEQRMLSVPDYYSKLSETFARILPRYFRGGEPLELSLTGGLDSRMIIAAASMPAGSLPCHTFGGRYRECADVRLARRIAEMCGQPHRVVSVKEDFFTEFPELAVRSIRDSDGTMDVTGAVESYANRAVREFARVRLTGSYGSEVLRSQVAFRPWLPPEPLFSADFVLHLRKAAATYNLERGSHRLSFIVFKQVPWYHYGRRAVEQSQIGVRSPFLDNELVALAYQAPGDASVNRRLAHRFIADHHAGLAGIPTDRGVIGMPSVGKHRIREFCQEFFPRLEYLYDYGMPQWLASLDHAAKRLHIERLFLGRQKFYHFRPWYRDELASWVRAVLLDPKSLARPYLNSRRVEQVVNAHVQGRENHTLEIHKLLTAELIQRELIERN